MNWHLKKGVRAYHEIVDGAAPDPAQPRLRVDEAHLYVLLHAGQGDGPVDVWVQEVVPRDLGQGRPAEDLVGRRHVLVEDALGDGRQGGVGDPGAVVAGQGLAQLVRLDVGHGLGVGVLVVLDRYQGRHAAHGVDAAAVAGADEQPDVGVHERHRHVDVDAVRQDEFRVVLEHLDEGEDVVPPTAVETTDVILELVDDLYKQAPFIRTLPIPSPFFFFSLD